MIKRLKRKAKKNVSYMNATTFYRSTNKKMRAAGTCFLVSFRRAEKGKKFAGWSKPRRWNANRGDYPQWQRARGPRISRRMKRLGW